MFEHRSAKSNPTQTYADLHFTEQSGYQLFLDFLERAKNILDLPTLSFGLASVFTDVFLLLLASRAFLPIISHSASESSELV